MMFSVRRGITTAVFFLSALLLFALFSFIWPDWISLCAAWLFAVCVAFTAETVCNPEHAPHTLNSTLNRLAYYGLAVCPTLPVNFVLYWLLQHILPDLGAQALAALAAALLCPVCVHFLSRPLTRLEKILNEETVSYLFFGVLTTVLNIAIHWFFSELLTVNPMISNVIAWIGGVIFAYATNRRFVFDSHTTGKAAWIEAAGFLLARLFSLAVDQGGMALCLYLLHWSNMPSKILMNVIVIILNYIFSKLFVFRTNTSD